MQETIDRTGIRTSLMAQLEDLATDLVIGGAPGDIAAQFARLSASANAEGWLDTSRGALALSRSVEDNAANYPEAESAIAAGLAHLRSVLEAESTGSLKAPVLKSAPANSLSSDPELMGDFLVESREHLESIEGRMLVLEQNPDEMETIHGVFRSFHTMKGLAGFLEIMPIRDVSHEVETLLDLARNSKLAITPGVVDVVLESADYLKEALNTVEASLNEGADQEFADNRSLIQRIQRMIAGEIPESAVESEPERETEIAPFAQEELSGTAAPARQGNSKNGQTKASESFSVRVETAKLDYLMDMVGEMVIAQSLIRHNPALTSIQDSRLLGDISQLTRITGEVQRTTMDMRMLPIGQVFQRTGRLVRDLSRKAGKRVELQTTGEETEVDKTIAEALCDPLMHMVRNSIDHGIETPEERAVTGKNPVATVRLAAYHNGGQIVIEVADDGRGLNRDKILNKAQRNGLIENGSHLSDNDVFNLIFEPGFSTAEQVTDISGRGVGMDVVRKHVQKLRGRIDIQSKLGQGTTFFLKLPLTLAIIEGLVVKVGSEQYIVPIFAIREIFRPTADSISTVHGQDEMVLVRGSLLPVVRLYRHFGVTPRSEDPCQSLLLVAECQGKTFCLMVDELVGKQEVVIKSLGETLKNIPGIAGGAILGDGRVGLILDMDGVYRRGKS